MLEPIAAKALYEMMNLRLMVGGTMDLKIKRKPALMAKTKRKLTEQAEPEKNASHCLLFTFQGPNNQNKGPTRRIVHLNAVFSRRSP